jgi:hypothetical protein
VRELLESLDELQLENEHLRSENESLLAAQEQIAAALRGEDALLPDPARPPASLFDALRELRQLRESLQKARAEALDAHAALRALESSRAFGLLRRYWAWRRRRRLEPRGE